MNTRRLLQAGAVWAWPQLDNPLTEARARYDITGIPPRIVESPLGLAASFDGTNKYITLKDSEEFLLRFDSGSQDFSIAAWLRFNNLGNNLVIMDKRDANDDGWIFWIDDSDQPALNIQAIDIKGPPVVSSTKMYSVVATVDRSGNGIVYVDGVAGTPVAIGGAVMATTTLPRIGTVSYAASAWFNGDVAGIAIWDRILTAAEALALSTGRAF